MSNARNDSGGLNGTDAVAAWTGEQMAVIQAYGFDPMQADHDLVDTLVEFHDRKTTPDVSEVTTMRVESVPNPAPAMEEGPHLKDPEIREAKRQQMVEAGLSPDDESLTDDMREILREGS
jgi:hypothetical protein